MLANMETWDVSRLKGARVWIKIVGKGGSELQGTIEAALKPFVTEDREQVVTLTLFSVRLDSGELVEVSGSNVSRIDSKSYP